MIKFEPRHKPLVSRPVFFARLLWHALGALVLIAAALAIGVAGYHYLENLPWTDALLNASMILGGMGPVNPLQTEAGKLFASAYALFSGLLFVAALGLLFAPLIHRMLHRFHLEEDGAGE